MSSSDDTLNKTLISRKGKRSLHTDKKLLTVGSLTKGPWGLLDLVQSVSQCWMMLNALTTERTDPQNSQLLK